MMCPKCYGSMNKTTGVCNYCGFSVHDLVGATNKKAKEAKRKGKKDDVLYSTKLPNDVSKKKLMLYGGLLGMFGAHNFYVGKIATGVYQATAVTLMILSLIFTEIFSYVYWVQQFQSVALTLGGIAILMWIVDFIAICLNKYKVPVYKDEYSVKKEVKTEIKSDKK